MIRRFLHKKVTRGEFVRSLGRYVALGVLALLAAWMLRRRGPRSSGDGRPSCEYDLPCRQCAELPGCRPARAAAARRALRRANL